MDAINYPAWLPDFLKLYNVPQRPSITVALRWYVKGLADPAQAPTYSQVRRALRQYEAEVGELRGRRPSCLLQHASDETSTAYCPICKQIVSGASNDQRQEVCQRRAGSLCGSQ